MKINEILVEAGVLSTLGQGVKASVAGLKQKQSLRKSNKELSAAADDAIKNYNQFLSAYTAAKKKVTPDIASEWLAKYLGAQPESKPSGIQPNQMRDWVTKELGNYFATRQLGTQQKTTTGQPQVTSPQDPILTQVKLMGKSPLVYQFGGKRNLFTVNDKNQWVRYTPGSSKGSMPIDANTQQILNNAAKRDQIDLAKIQPTPPAQQPEEPPMVEPTTQTVVQTVITPTGQTVFKKSDNKWYRENGKVIDDTVDTKRLDQLVINAKEIARSKNTEVPKVIKAQSTAPTDLPAVFSSNRQPAVFKSNRPQ